MFAGWRRAGAGETAVAAGKENEARKRASGKEDEERQREGEEREGGEARSHSESSGSGSSASDESGDEAAVASEPTPLQLVPAASLTSMPLEERWGESNLPVFRPLAELCGPDQRKNTYGSPFAGDFLVRGPGYLAKHKTGNRTLKVTSEAAPFEIAGVNVFSSRRSLQHVAAKLRSLKEYLARYGPAEDGLPRFVVICFTFKDLWSGVHSSVVHLFRRNERVPMSAAFRRAFGRFAGSTDHAFCAERLKFVFKVQNASAALRATISMLGGERPVLIAKKLTTSFHRGANYLEVDQDVGSSKVASMLNGTMLKASGGMVVDMAWLCEAREEDELPECVLGALRYVQSSFADVCVDLDADAPLDHFVQPE
jgi:hypothetical protein